METESEVVAKRPSRMAKRPSRMTSVREWFSLRVTHERTTVTKTEAPEELRSKGEATRAALEVAVDEGATAAPPSKPSVGSKGEATGAETGKDELEPKASKEDGDEGGSTAAARLGDAGVEGEGEEDKPKDDKKEDDKPKDDKKEDDAPPRNFWKEAWDSEELGEDRRKLLQGRSGVSKAKDPKADQKPSRANATKLVKLVIEDTETKMARYKARWGSEGGESSLGKARSILVSALTVKGVLDSIVQFDPTGYCSAAWAVVSFGLTLALHDKELTDLTFNACSYLTDLMALYSRIEAHYHTRKVSRGEQLEDALVRVYTAILVYAAEVRESTNGKARTRIKKVILSLAQQPLVDLQGKIDEEKAKLKEWQTQVESERADEARKELTDMKDAILKRVDNLAEITSETLAKATDQELERLCGWLLDQDEGRQEKIRKSLANETAWWLNSGNSQWKQPEDDGSRKGKKYVPGDTETDETSEDEDEDDRGSETGENTTDPGGSEDDEVKHRTSSKPPDIASTASLERDGDGTDELGDWLFRETKYTEWVKYPQGLLWLHGNSGCGKSALCSSIIKNLKKTFGNDKTKAIASWYFRFDHDDTKKMDLVLASLLGQLASQCKSVPDKDLYTTLRNYHRRKQLPDDSMDLFKHLQEFISKADRDIFLVLDGVDQVSDRRGSRKGDIKLVDMILKLMQKEYANLHVLVVSKFEKDMEQDFESIKTKDMLVSVDVGEALGKALDTLIERKLMDNPVLVADDSEPLKEEVRQRLKHDNSSNFHWARAILRRVSGCREPAEVQAELKRLPDAIALRYQDALGKVADNDGSRMRTILLWLVNQKRALSQAELAAAVNLRHPKEIAEICPRVLVETATEDKIDVFRFTHFSVEEYLKDAFARVSRGLDSAKSGSIARLLPPQEDEAHLLMAKRCLEILLSASRPTKANKKKAAIGFRAVNDSYSSTSDTDLDRHDSAASGPGRRRVTIAAGDHDLSDHRSDAWPPQDTSADDSAPDQRAISRKADSKNIDGPARKYAAEFWFYHYNKINSTKVSATKLKDLEVDICSKLLLDKEKMRAWLDTHDPDEEKNRKTPSPVYYAVKLDLKRILTRLVEGIDKKHTNPTSTGRRKALDQPGHGGTALQLAADRGESGIIDLLHTHGADVNAEKGIHGTALYAAAAKGHAGAVDKLLQAGATAAGAENHGDLGSPLHVAAFRGYDAVVSLLLGPSGVPVDHPADPFGTALQAACAAKRINTIRLLLDNDANPNIVAGCFGTAAQAVLAYPSPPDGPNEVLEMLRSKDAELVESPTFWTSAYRNATSSLESRTRYRMRGLDWAAASYAMLLEDSGPTWPGVEELEAPEQHELLASVVYQWTLPSAAVVGEFRLSRRLLARVPFQDQLDAIKRAIPHHENTLKHLRHHDFLNKARFWAGINYILGQLPDLVGKCLHNVTRLLRRREYSSTLLAFQWALPESEDLRRERLDEDGWLQSRMHKMYAKLNPRAGYLRLTESRMDDDSDDAIIIRSTSRNDAFAVANPMARTDAITLELAQRRQRQRRLEEALQTSASEEAQQELRSLSQSGVWTMSDILDLVKNLIEYGDRCARYHDAFTAAVEPPNGRTDEIHRQNIEDLTFELFSAVIRLALALEDHGTSFEKLARPIQLLVTVRLERIKQLDILCERGLPSAAFGCEHTCACSNGNNTNAPSEINHDLNMDAQKIAAAVAQQVEQLIGNKLAAAAQRTVAQDFGSQVATAVKEEVARAMEQAERNLAQKMQGEVQRQLAEAYVP